MKHKSITFYELLEKNRACVEKLAEAGPIRTNSGSNARALLMLSQGLTREQIAASLGFSKNRISKVRSRFLLWGLHGVHDPEPKPLRAGAPWGR